MISLERSAEVVWIFFPWQAVILCLVHVELVCPLPLLPSLSILLTQLISFSTFQCVLGTSLTVRSEFQKVSQIPPNERQMIDPSDSKRSSWKHHLSGAPELAAERWATHRELQAVSCAWLPLVCTGQSLSYLSYQVLNPQVLKSHRRFKWQYLSHPLLCSLSDSLKRHLETSVHAISPSQPLRNSAMLRHFWHNRELCSFPSLVSGLSEGLLCCTLTSLALFSQRAEVSHQSLEPGESLLLTRH